MTAAPVINVRNLVKKYGNLTAVDNISFSVKKGEIFGFLGPNGAGKTTTIKALLGLIFPTSGTVNIRGFDVLREGKEARKNVGYLPEKVAFYDNLDAMQTLRFFAEMKTASERECTELLKELNLHDAADRKIRAFSKGMIKRLGLAIALLDEPQLLILDEPTTGLDPQGSYKIKRKILQLKEQGVTVFLSSHVLSEVQEVCDRVGILNKGKLVALDSVDGLTKRLQLKTLLSVRVKNVSERLKQAIQKEEKVEQITVKDDDIINIVCPPEIRIQVLRVIEESGGIITSFRTREPSLEEIFMRYMEG